MGEKRTENFRKNNDLEDMLKDINHILAEPEQKITVPDKQRYPIIFVVGALRSGTTLMTQWLASTGEIASLTIVALCSSAEVGVGATIAPMSHRENGI